MTTTETSPGTAEPSAGRLLLIDGHSMAFRAYFALPVDSFTTSTGQTTNAVHGFVSMFLSLLEQEEPTHVAVAFDLPGGTFRTEEYDQYKATRDETPAPFVGQVELVDEVLSAMRVRTVTAEGFEADDILATLAARGQEEGMEVLICSGDRDSFQTVTERCTVLYPVKGVSTMRRMTPAEVEERYGVPPQRYPHLAALVGESSDNLPGVPGVGPKTAAKWINLYDGLEGVIAHADQIKGKAGQSLRDHLDDVLRNRRLNHLRTDLELGIDPLRDLAVRGADRTELARVMEVLEFRTLHQRAERVLDFDSESPGATGGPAEDLEVAVLGHDLTPGALAGWLGEHFPAAGTPVVLGLDVVGETSPGRGRAGIVALSDGSRAVALDLEAADEADTAALSRLLADPDRPLVVADAKGAWHALSGSGIALDGVVADPSLAGYVCRPEQRSYDIATLAQRWLGIDLELMGSPAQETGTQSSFDLDALDGSGPRAEELAAARRAAVVLPLQRVLEEHMAQIGALELYEDLEMPVAATLAAMEDAGIAVDDAVLAARAEELDRRVERSAAAAYAAVGHEVNLASPKQLQTVLFDELEMPRTRKTKTGYTTDAGALADLLAKTGHPFLVNLLEHRDATKLRQTVEGLRKAVGPDSRVHTTFQQTVAATGRLSSKDPNLQNIPARTEEGRRIREAFTVGPEHECLMTADYSQIEMRIMAHLSADEALIEAFRSGEDLHRYVAALVHDVEVEDITADQRNRVKAMSYGLAYGLSTFGLAKQLGIDNAEAAALRDAYFARFGRVHDYLVGVVEQARRDGYTATMFGRRRYLPDLTSDNRQRREIAERAALNAPIQGSAADIVKRAMVEVSRALEESGLASRILLQIHDELLLEIARGEAQEVERLVRERMASAASLAVPLDVSVGRGTTWAQAAH
ncbi:MAG: DNA polymerase I [Actinomyces sp.]|uniref:DNA polymerase I n=1 Tax=Actinomyces sp. TaxID=29317 RepID=UPI0026DC2BE7|nr:DNA polymerase I [Actinomyces sp.]MDO4243881.1 DNA polymerase I [Actinomyces sp.]